MTVLRSAIFQAAFYLFTAAAALLFVPALVAPRGVTVWAMEQWARGVAWLLRRVAGIGLDLRGREHLPGGAAIVAAKHQSAFDTVIFHDLLHDPAIVMKRELMLIPAYGWLARKVGMIAVDRHAGAKALRSLVRDAAAAAAAGRPILIFPEGTRTAPGTRVPYQPGVAALYKQLHLPVVPVALNSGLFWPRRSFLKRPGTIVIEVLPAIPPGLQRSAFAAALQTAIETASERLLAEARPGDKPGGESVKTGDGR